MNSKTLIGAVIAAVLAVAVYYGLISRQSADTIQNQANQTLGTGPAQPTSSTPPTTPATAPPSTAAPQTNPSPPAQ